MGKFCDVWVRAAAIALAMLMWVDAAQACAVCFGDPESPMVKGAAAGVWAMIAVVGFVLVGVAGTGVFWMQRGRKYARMMQDDAADSDSN